VAVAALVLSGVWKSAGGARSELSASNRGVLSVAVPTMMVGVLLSPVVGYNLGVQALAGVIASSVFMGAALAMVFANAGSALVNARLYGQAEAAAGSAGTEGAAIESLAKILCDSCPTAINASVKMVAVAAIVLVPWFVRVL